MFTVVKTTGLHQMVLALGYLSARTGIQPSSWSHVSTKKLELLVVSLLQKNYNHP